MISVKNLFFIFLDMKGTGGGQGVFFFCDHSGPAAVEMEECSFPPVPAV